MSGIFSGGDELDSDVHPALIAVFDTVAVTATAMLALTLAPPILCSNVHRSKMWISMITTMMLFPLFYLLTAGSQFQAGVTPPIGLCILQAGFIYAAPPTATTAVLCFITDMTLGLRATLFNKKRSQSFMSFLLVLPSILFGCVFFEAIVLVNADRGVHFNPVHMFCASDTNAPQSKVSAALTVVSLFLTICMEVWTWVTLYRNWPAVRNFRRTRTDIQLGVMVRLGVFTLIAGLAAVLGAVSLPNDVHGGAIWNIFLVTVPLLAALSFGTRRDIMSAYAFWNWRKNGFDVGKREAVYVQSSVV
ncbi:hypothetical protein K438DRAFT_144849 [Mycena galopus ATCC 62051]|nr:hypothetical protein K438DRAFT_144849 [Mycena galopus ATCC 62051]